MHPDNTPQIGNLYRIPTFCNLAILIRYEYAYTCNVTHTRQFDYELFLFDTDNSIIGTMDEDDFNSMVEPLCK